jgi:replication-associated recombination protein RarA
MKTKQQKLLNTPTETEEQKVEKYKGFELRTKNGYKLDEIVSALQKEIRRGNELMASYWAFEMNDSGFWRYCFRRLQVIAGEDVGLANPEAMVLVSSTYASLLAQDKVKKMLQVDNNILGFVVSYMARSKKSRHIDYLGGVLLKRKEQGWKSEIPEYAIDEHTERGRELGKDDSEFFREGSRITNKKMVVGEEPVKKACLELYGFTEKRDENQF